MSFNLELKAPIPSIAWGVRRAKALGAVRADLLIQRDTYFNVRQGRLKLREIRGRKAELIGYRRPDVAGGRYSDYQLLPVDEPRKVLAVLTATCGVRVIVSKRRVLYRYQNARIHLDQVKGLGTFIEFEVEVVKGRRQAERLFALLVEAFAIDPKRTIGHSYSDMG